ncbi:helix-turn-helix domain-containing protein [Burkholderia gladioli]|uniref:helix-turn-helix domain-containing protein n=1 Tax=Burkholderia gladioli TaxID=28095 RepID=UPI001641AEBB|nr:helix-turn-helix transcriptional regulator [Burkholderia gladioli]HDR9251513.1 helix-turn-helix transcriptional regulator [Burkholderia vietnamiensis]
MNKKEIQPWLRDVLARNLRRVRGKTTQEDLSDQCGFHRTYVSQVERSLANVSIDNLQRLAEALQVTPMSLLDPAPPKSEPNDDPSHSGPD